MFVASFFVISSVFTVASAGISLDFEGTTLELSSSTKLLKYYKYTYSDSTFKLYLKCVTEANNKNGKFHLQMDGLGHKTTIVYANFEDKSYYKLEHTFELHGLSGNITCSACDDSVTSSTCLYAVVYCNFEPLPITNVETTVQSQSFIKQNLAYILLTCAVLVILCTSVCAVVIWKRNKTTPEEDSYVNLANNQQHEYNTLPIPIPRNLTPRNAPTVEESYSEPKDSNDMSDALYADPARMTDSTYAEPYIPREAMYAQPIPKALRKPKITDDPNYSNVFGKDYVNSLRK